MQKFYHLLALTLLLYLPLSTMAQQAIIVEHNDTPHIFDRLDSAISFASDGDDIYISGGNFNIGTVIIDKELRIYGVGHDPDSTQATNRSYLDGTIKFVTGADNCLLSGVYLTNHIYVGSTASNSDITNLQLVRNNLNYLFLSYNGATQSLANNVIVHENIIRGYFMGGYASNVNVKQNIIGSHLRYLQYAYFYNNIFNYYNGSGNSYYDVLSYGGSKTINHCFFINNYFRDYLHASSASQLVDNCVFNNNAFSDVSFNVNTGSNYGSNNLYNVSTADFVSFSTDPYAADYHFSNTSNAKNAGDDGTDIGIYGTFEPFKEGSVPVNPHVQAKLIYLQNNVLNLQIRVKAQSR